MRPLSKQDRRGAGGGLASRTGVEPVASGLGNLRSILLSYRDRSTRTYHSAAGRRKTRALGLALLLAAQPIAARAACDGAGGEAVTVTGIGDDFSVALADGRSLRLAGIDPVASTPEHPSLPDEARTRAAGWLVGHTAVALPLTPGVDRWGRIAALLFAPGGTGDRPGTSPGGPLSVALALVDAGLARGRPETGFAACWPALREAEARARESGLGLWGDPYYAVLQGGDPIATADLTGTMVVVEGRVGRVGQGRTRLFIGLGTRRDTVTVSIARRDLFILGQAGLDDKTLVGTDVRVRGELDERGGPSIDVSDADQIEVVGRPEATRPDKWPAVRR